ncbi:MAG: DNA-directed RNA polymerase subunit omega [Bacteroidales bacterium]|nr:DNA-directed RNA polymerase subunit omega [Bacteroidales bacterium]MDD4575610.1 DNA-directed RNA polymerase subunit omega [Bacteroidales bacterium]
MDYRKYNADTQAVTRNLNDFDKETENIYESIVVLAKRANQISSDLKEELNRKIEEFSTSNDNLDEVFENREQIELARYYEQLPKATLMAIHEYLNDMIYYRNPSKEKDSIE